MTVVSTIPPRVAFQEHDDPAPRSPRSCPSWCGESVDCNVRLVRGSTMVRGARGSIGLTHSCIFDTIILLCLKIHVSTGNVPPPDPSSREILQQPQPLQYRTDRPVGIPLSQWPTMLHAASTHRSFTRGHRVRGCHAADVFLLDAGTVSGAVPGPDIPEAPYLRCVIPVGMGIHLIGSRPAYAV